MGRRSKSIDGILQRLMTVAGVLLVLMILGKAVGMSDVRSGISVSMDGKTWAAQCLMGIWRYSYPAGKTAVQPVSDHVSAASLKAGNSAADGWFSVFVNQNPVFRYLTGKQSEDRNIQELDPAYETYLSSRLLYEEQPYPDLNPDEAGGEAAVLENESEGEGQPAEPGEEEPAGSDEIQAASGAGGRLPVTGTLFLKEQLADYDFLMKQFYSVHTSTTATREEMDANRLLEKDLTMEKNPDQPQILIYHTHSQEAYADYGPENPEATVVGAGKYLTELLEAKGYRVIHHTGVFDLVDGELDRSKAYTYALDAVTGILQENPSIQVVLDLHRDGVKEGMHLISQVGGKQTAQLMFFNGMSQTPDGTIEYLPNPYKEDNLAFSLNMQLDAAAYYPGLTRKIYLKGLRYNLHLRPRSALVEVGAQTNTSQEALNAMEPLSELLDMVLQGT